MQTVGGSGLDLLAPKRETGREKRSCGMKIAERITNPFSQFSLTSIFEATMSFSCTKYKSKMLVVVTEAI